MSANDALLMGLDLGTSRIKAVLAGRGGGEVAASSAPTPLRTDDRGRVECTAEALLSAVAEALDGLDPDARRRVEGVGLAGMAESGMVIDRSGRPASPVVSWNDRRGQEVVDRLHAQLGPDLDRGIGQRLRTVSSVAKLGWLVDQGRAATAARWTGVPELVLATLTGAWATEHSLAARNGAYHLGEQRWMPEVTSALGLGDSVFPPIESAGSRMGTVTPEGAAWSGLPRGAAVTIAGHDHLAGLVGAGVGRLDMANSVGTAETLVTRAATRPDPDRALAARVAVTLAPGDGGWALLASALRSGIVVETAASLLGRAAAELDKLAAEAGDGRSSDSGADLSDAGPSPAGLSDAELSDLATELASGRRPALPDADPGLLWRGLLRTLASRTRDAFDRVATVTPPPRRLVAFGGGSRSRLWMEMKAEALPVPVWTSSVVDAVARGAVVFAGVAAGWWPDSPAAPAPTIALVPRP